LQKKFIISVEKASAIDLTSLNFLLDLKLRASSDQLCLLRIDNVHPKYTWPWIR